MAIQFDEVVASGPEAPRGNPAASASPSSSGPEQIHKTEQELRRLRARRQRLSAT